MELTPEVIKKLSKDQLELLKELGELAEKEFTLTEKIELNRRQAEKAGIGRERELPEHLMDDREYDNLISVQLIYEREQIKAKIRSVIDSLIISGLGDLGIIQRHAENYGINPNKYKV